MTTQHASPALTVLFEKLTNANGDCELADCVRSIVNELGGESYVFAVLSPRATTASRPTHRFLIGCSPEWCQMYNANKWYMTDPFLEYARSNTAPITGSEIVVETQGQREMLAAASENGFRSGIVIPVHTSVVDRLGVLYVGSNDSQAAGEKRLTAHRMYFRALASELLDWFIRMVKSEVVDGYGITEMDLRIIGYLRTGFAAADIAREMGVSIQTVYGNYKRIKDKVGVSHISEAVKFAEANDLLA
ncbi:autoinducer binding domain-containing protein [Burkholderia sp. Ax-1724]|uniref:helix-turn-helix transcriptional regulator n=1 Tax=Burkholderia sp. Ax-1724 TaxID=2608336 RepID=UPI00141E1CEA|nr:autoinducer binding domain-containing protein [Burkholderia sp. Ax-1724]NIF56091.1 hypothetical protein [Burkholderia sp. Ax-1724]